MFTSMRRLLTPLSYLRIEREGKFFDEIVLPLLLLGCTLIFFFFLSGRVAIFGSDGVISAVVGYLQIVTGFYIASLAAVATFNKQSMDDPMPGTPTVLHVRRRGKTKEEQLTRRRFLCYLFGYLSFVSLSLYFLGSALNLSAVPIKEMIDIKYHFIFKWTGAAVYLFAVYNMLVTTLLGLYYMTDRIHRPTSEFVDKSVPGVRADFDFPDDDDQ